MNICEEEQTYTDFDWFCVDAAGELGHFATAGRKRLPASVADSADNLSLIKAFFNDELPADRGFVVDQSLQSTVAQPDERYFRSFAGMASRGFYTFDAPLSGPKESTYFRVAVPNKPLKLHELPRSVRDVLSKTKLEGRLLQHSSTIAYEETFEHVGSATEY